MQIGPRQTLECELIDAPIDRIEGALRAGGLIFALVGLARQPRATWRTVQILSANGRDGQMMAQEMYSDTAYQIPNPKHSVVRVVIFPKEGVS
jgi:hypothetical protein